MRDEMDVRFGLTSALPRVEIFAGSMTDVGKQFKK